MQIEVTLVHLIFAVIGLIITVLTIFFAAVKFLNSLLLTPIIEKIDDVRNDLQCNKQDVTSLRDKVTEHSTMLKLITPLLGIKK